jgi:phage shock protein PspC (stress-responsive transcriptional regulator)
VLRRSSDDRVAAGVAGGLGEYFGVDPVLFRVLIATAAFFGGAGVLGYLVAWAAIPEAGTVTAPIDRFVAGLRRRRVPVWLVVAAAGLVLWAIAFSWWAPGRFFPLIAVVIVLVAVFGRRARRNDLRGDRPSDLPSDLSSTSQDLGAPSRSATAFTAPTVRLDKAPGEPAGGPTDSPQVAGGAEQNRAVWISETRQWIDEAKQASRERRRRSWPVRITMLCSRVLALVALGIADAVSGIAIPTYFWTVFGIALGGLLVGMVLRRTPWSMVAVLLPSVVGLIAFAPTNASLHDGTGQRDWTPTTISELQDNYRLAFGQGVLDLTQLGPLAGARTVHVRVAAGQVRILIPPTMNVLVHAKVHIGDVDIDGAPERNGTHGGIYGGTHGGWGLDRTILPPPAATGAQLTVQVDLADGQVRVDHSA